MRTVIVSEGAIALTYTPDDGSQQAVLLMTNSNDQSAVGQCTTIELDPSRVHEISIAFARLAAELAALPPSDIAGYVEERDLGRTDHEDGGPGDEAMILNLNLHLSGMPESCPICSGDLTGDREMTDGGHWAYWWWCNHCTYKGGRS